MRYKFVISLLLVLLLMSSANALTELTSCGSVSTSHETYILNFTEVTSNNCLNVGLRENVTFIGLNQTINMNGYDNFIYVDRGSNGVSFTGDGYYFRDFVLQGDYPDTSAQSFFYAYGRALNNGISQGWTDINLTNMELRDIHYIVKYNEGAVGSGSQFPTGFINDVTFQDVFVSTQELGGHVDNPSFGGNYLVDINNFNFQDSFLILNGAISYITGTANDYYDFDFDDSVIAVYGSVSTNAGNYYDASILRGYTENEANPLITNNADIIRFSNQFNNYTALELYSEDSGSLISSDMVVVLVNDETFNRATNKLVIQNRAFDTSLITSTLDTYNSVNIANGELDCGLVNNNLCAFVENTTNHEFNPDNLNHDYVGSINLGDNSNITKLNFTSQDESVSQSVTAFIGNTLDSAISNIEIKESVFNMYRAYSTASREDGFAPISFNIGNNLLIYNNTFYLSNHSDATIETIDIVSGNPTTNIISRNNFSDLRGVAQYSVNTTVTRHNLDAKFYDNYLGNNYVVNRFTVDSDMINTVLLSEEISNTVYYWNVSNYHTQNQNCTDGDTNGRCDSSFLSGNVTELYPLVDYPFVPLTYILDADYEASVVNITVTLDEVNLTQSVVVNPSDVIVTSFSQNSDLLEIICYGYIAPPSQTVTGSILSNVEQSTTYPMNITPAPTGWTTDVYNYRVECYTYVGVDVVFGSSETLQLNVTLSGEGGEGNETGLDDESTVSDILNQDIIGDTPQETFENGKSLVTLYLNPIVNILVIIGMIAGVLILGGIIVGLFSLVMPRA